MANASGLPHLEDIIAKKANQRATVEALFKNKAKALALPACYDAEDAQPEVYDEGTAKQAILAASKQLPDLTAMLRKQASNSATG